MTQKVDVTVYKRPMPAESAAVLPAIGSFKRNRYTGNGQGESSVRNDVASFLRYVFTLNVWGEDFIIFRGRFP